MWRVWLLFDPRRALVALFTFLFVLAPMVDSCGPDLERTSVFLSGF